MDKLEKPPTVPEPMVDKVMAAVMQGYKPKTLPFYKALGVEAEQRGIVPTSKLGPFGFLRDRFSQDAQSLIKEQAAVDAVGTEMLKTFTEFAVQQELQKRTAPTYEEANKYGLGLKPPMELVPSEAYGPGTPVPMPGTEGNEQNQRMFMSGYTAAPGGTGTADQVAQAQATAQQLYPTGLTEGPRPMAMAEVPNTKAKISPFEQQMLHSVMGQPGVIEGGKFMPTSMSKPRTDMMSPEEFGYGLKFLDKSGFLPDGLRAGDYELPQAPIPRTEGTAMLNGLRTAATQTANDRTTMNRIANAHYGKDFNDLPKGGREQQDVVKRYALMQPMAQQQVMLSTPVTPEVGETLFDRKAFEETGELVPRPDVSNATARSKEVVRISEKNMDTLQEVEKSAVSLDQIFDYSKRIVTAKTPTQAALQAARYAANSNPMTRMVPGVYDAQMASYYDMVEALGNGLAKAFGGERGVLTNVDVKRWVNALPKPGDTVEVRGVKETALRRLAQAAAIAQRRAISGDRGETKKLREDMHSTMDNILKPLEEQGKPPAPKKSPEDRYNELSKSGMKDDAIYKQMATEGY